MESVNSYLAKARNNASQKYANFDGNGFAAAPNFFGAGGAGMGASASQPYIITLTSTSGAAVSDFDVLGSYQYVYSSNFTAGGDLVIGSITISSGISGITYREMLSQFANQPFNVGLTYYQSATSAQVLETLTLNTRDANGNQAQKTLVPTIDPYQQQSDIVAMNQNFSIDGFTKLTLRNVLANATVKIYLYPADNINLARGLAGEQVSRRYVNPGIVKAQPIQLQGS